MILTPLLEKLQTAILAVVFLAAGLITFGNALVFDRLYIGILLFACWLCRSEWNLLSIIAIIALERVVEEMAWITLTNEYMIKLPLYCLCTYLIYKFCQGSFRWYCFFCISLVFGSEIYWLLTNYLAPEIYWDVYYLAQTLLTRWLFVHRCFLLGNLTAERFPGTAKSLELDYLLANLMTGYAILSSFQILEYLLRHSLGFHDIAYIHASYPYVAHSFSIFILFSIFLNSIRFRQVNSIIA